MIIHFLIRFFVELLLSSFSSILILLSEKQVRLQSFNNAAS